MDLQAVTAAMIAYDAGDPMRIHHFLKVHAFARLIGLSEGLSADLQEITEDIGIHRAEALYGSSAGKYQEELGPAEAEALLRTLNAPSALTARVSYLVGHHHTYTNIDGLDYQILVEADFLVNLYEDQIPAAAKKHAYASIFRTESGKRLCRELYPEVTREE